MMLGPIIPDVHCPVPVSWRVGVVDVLLTRISLFIAYIFCVSQEYMYPRARGPIITIYKPDPYASLCKYVRYTNLFNSSTCVIAAIANLYRLECQSVFTVMSKPLKRKLNHLK